MLYIESEVCFIYILYMHKFFGGINFAVFMVKLPFVKLSSFKVSLAELFGFCWLEKVGSQLHKPC